jgi:putative copper export protein
MLKTSIGAVSLQQHILQCVFVCLMVWCLASICMAYVLLMACQGGMLFSVAKQPCACVIKGNT